MPPRLPLKAGQNRREEAAPQFLVLLVQAPAHRLRLSRSLQYKKKLVPSVANAIREVV